VFITYAFKLGLCVLRRTYRQDYETLFHVVILIKHHHHQLNMEELSDKLLDVSDPLSINYGKHMTKVTHIYR
jgi:hypothetical protein